MRKCRQYDDLIKEMPLENGGRDLAPAIIEAAGIIEAKPVRKAINHWTGLNTPIPQATAYLGLAVLLLAYGLVYPDPHPMISERMGLNTVAMCGHVEDGFKSAMGGLSLPSGIDFKEW